MDLKSICIDMSTTMVEILVYFSSLMSNLQVKLSNIRIIEILFLICFIYVEHVFRT